MADSGAIFITLMPFPRQSDLTPPSFNICLKPSLIVNLFFFSIFCPWTWKKIFQLQSSAFGMFLKWKRANSHIVSYMNNYHGLYTVIQITWRIRWHKGPLGQVVIYVLLLVTYAHVTISLFTYLTKNLSKFPPCTIFNIQ